MTPEQRIPPALLDAALAALLAVVVVVVAMIALATEPGAQEPDALAYGLGLTIAALVLVRRRRPLAVLAASYAALTLYHVLNYPATGLAFPLSVALYTAAAAGHLGWALAAVATQLAGAAWYRLLVEGEPLPGVIVNGALLDAALMVALVLLGEAVRSRRAWQAEVAERLRGADAAREREAERRVGQERLRIARELHDVLAHTVAVIAVQAGVAADVLDDRPDQARTALTAIRSASREAMTELLKATVGVLRDGSPSTATRGRCRGRWT